MSFISEAVGKADLPVLAISMAVAQGWLLRS